ncbi:MAG: START domain-containing protein [Saprospiraceae bacterium]|nr:START domain-containing protein [Saprospiraceae bacterium]MDW8230824.1 START domain-containing protein [Saprospiraceae bacterium]
MRLPFALLSLLFLSAAFLCPLLLNAQKSDEWILKNQKDGIKVYYRQTGDVHELKLITSVRASLPGIVLLLDDPSRYTEWVYRSVEARCVKRLSETEMYYYVRLDFPWPLSDRDLIMHTKIRQDPHTRALIWTSTAVPDLLPEQEDVIRIRRAHSKWLITPAAPGVLSVEYHLYSHPGGSLPSWLVNTAVDVGPLETIKGLCRLLLEARYQNARLAHIRE